MLRTRAGAAPGSRALGALPAIVAQCVQQLLRARNRHEPLHTVQHLSATCKKHTPAASVNANAPGNVLHLAQHSSMAAPGGPPPSSTPQPLLSGTHPAASVKSYAPAGNALLPAQHSSIAAPGGLRAWEAPTQAPWNQRSHVSQPTHSVSSASPSAPNLPPQVTHASEPPPLAPRAARFSPAHRARHLRPFPAPLASARAAP